MAADNRDIAFATFNLYNLQSPGLFWRNGKKYTAAEYKAKVDWAARMVSAMDADVIAFQELWSKQCLVDIFASAGLDEDYELHFITDDWYDIAVAAAVRKPWQVKARAVHKNFPDEMVLKKREVDHAANDEDEDDDIEVAISVFSRSILQLSIGRSDNRRPPGIEMFATHLKSKLPTRLDRAEGNNAAIKKHATALGSALSTIRRTAEAAALRVLLTKEMKGNDAPVVVLGDLNDGQLSNTLAVVTGQPRYRLEYSSRVGSASDVGLYSAITLQQYRSMRDVYYTHDFKGVLESLDHVLVSEQFYDHSRNRVWAFRRMDIWNDHVEDGDPATSDHGLVCARFDYDPA